MRKVNIVLLVIFLSIILIGCTKEITADTTVKTITVSSTVTSIFEDTTKIDELEKQLKDSKKELLKYQGLIGNLNNLLKNVYIGNAENSNYKVREFTAFNLKYKNKFYIVTAGHCVHYKYNGIDSGVYTKFNFKADFSDTSIYPKLLVYENDFGSSRDYAILYSDKITSGLDFDIKNTSPEYILGNEKNNIFKAFNTYTLKEGESGSPVVDLGGHVIGIATGNFVDIDLVIEAIDNLK